MTSDGVHINTSQYSQAKNYSTSYFPHMGKEQEEVSLCYLSIFSMHQTVIVAGFQLHHVL